METNNTYIELIEGGNVFKQGDRIDLAFRPLDYKSEIVDLPGKTIRSTIRKKGSGIMYEGTAEWSFEKRAIIQRTPAELEYGTVLIEFLVTDPDDPAFQMIFPSNETGGRLKINPSSESLDFVGVKMTTVSQLRQEQQTAQQEFEAAVIPRVETVEGKQAQLEADYQAAVGALTEDSEVILARGDKPTLGARLDDTAGKLAETSDELLNKANMEHVLLTVKWYGAKGDGVADDTVAIQYALDTHRGTLIFPQGNYKVTGNGEACLYLNKKLNLVGMDANFSKIRADNASATTSILKVAITDNYGFTDVRNLKIEGLGFAHNGGGLHGLLVKGGFQILSAEIKNNNFSVITANGGYSIYVEGNLAHSMITLNTIHNGIYMACYDANLVEKNVFFGNRVAVTYNLITGVFNNTVRANTLVNRDGAVHVINGSLIRISNNQMELAQGQGISQSPTSSMVWIEGRERPCVSVVVEENNFGGGTSVDHLIYVDNAYKAVIEKNQFVAVNIAEVYFTSKSRYCILNPNNTTRSETSNVRSRTFMKANVVDLGEGNVGVLKTADSLGLQNGWTMSTGGGFFKDPSGLIHFTGRLNSGVITSGTVIGTLPLGFRPLYFTYILCSTSVGVGRLLLDTNGRISVASLPSNAEVLPQIFLTATTE